MQLKPLSSSSSFGFPIRETHSGFSIHVDQILHLLSLLPPACPHSTHPNASSFGFPVFFCLAAACPAPFCNRIHLERSTRPYDIILDCLTLGSNMSSFNVPVMCSFLMWYYIATPQKTLAFSFLLLLAASLASLSSLDRRGSVVVSTSACHAASRGSIPGPGMFHY